MTCETKSWYRPRQQPGGPKIGMFTSALALFLMLNMLPAARAALTCGTMPSALDPTYATGGGAFGCQTSDYLFSNITVDSDSAATLGSEGIDGTILPTNAVNYVVPATGTMLAASSSSTQSISFLAPGPDMSVSDPLANFCDQNSRMVSGYQQGWCVNGANQVLASTISFEVTPLNGLIYSVGIDGTVNTHSSGGGQGGGASAVIFLEFCTQQVATAGSWLNNCGGEYGVIRGGIVNGQNQQVSYSNTASLLNGASQLWVRTTIYLSTDKGAGSWASVAPLSTSISNIAPVPEPGTASIVTLGVSLLAIFGRRRLFSNAGSHR